MADYPVVKGTREQAIVATEGQTEFGPLTFELFDAADLVVAVRAVGEDLYEDLTEGVTVTLAAMPGFPTVTLDEGLAEGDVLLCQSARIDARSTDVTHGGVIRSQALERELQRFTAVNQEIRRDLGRALRDTYDCGVVDALGARIANVADPEDDQDAATKKYVHAAVDDATGPPGPSAYEVWLAAGNEGTVQDFLDSLKSTVPGPPGEGSGNVNGPAEAISGNFPVFDGTTGKILADSGVAPAGFYTKSAADALLAAKEPLGELAGIRTITASDTLELADKGKVIEGNHASVAIVVTVPPNADVAFPVKTRIDIVRLGAAAMSVAAGAGVTIRSEGGQLALSAQYAAAQLYKRAADEWVLIGSLSA